MKTLLATTAIVLMASGPLMAQEAAPGAPIQPDAQAQDAVPLAAEQPMEHGTTLAHGELFLPSGRAGAMRASDLIGMDVVSSATDYGLYATDPVATADRSQWDAIGSVGDILVSPDGETRGILVDIGGFLGMGGRTVALDMSQVHFLRDESGVHFAAVNSTREALENAPEYVHADEMAQVTPPAAPTDPAAPAPQAGVADPADPLYTRPAFTREGFQDVDYAQLTASELQGATIYDANDDSIGSINELVLTADGAIDLAIVDVGGFLGIGAHTVALDFDELQIMRDADGSNTRIYIDQTRENLEQRPAYGG